MLVADLEVVSERHQYCLVFVILPENSHDELLKEGQAVTAVN
jgi:hypothetical protein